MLPFRISLFFISVRTSDVQQTEQIGSAITFKYQVKSAPSGYALEAQVKLCALDPSTSSITKCFTYDVLPVDISVYAPSVLCSGRRKKRAATGGSNK